jgi:hypothetical protein
LIVEVQEERQKESIKWSMIITGCIVDPVSIRRGRLCPPHTLVLLIIIGPSILNNIGMRLVSLLRCYWRLNESRP